METLSSASARCWCGNAALAPFSPAYLRCDSCASLVVATPPSESPAEVREEASSLYGLNYFVERARTFGFPAIEERARLDLGERAVYWLAALLRLRPPPARVLELGCANGAFVALLTAAGYDATGLDLSPAVTAFARETFGVRVVTGPLERQGFPPSAFDAIALFDVLEHLPDPVGTLRAAAAALAPDGILLVQTPRFDPALSYEALQAARHQFLQLLVPDEHLLLFSRASVTRLLAGAGLGHVEFAPAFFDHYDMFFVASRAPLASVAEETWRGALRHGREGRLVEALVDCLERGRRERDALQRHVDESEADRAARLRVIEQQGQVIDGQRSRLAALEAQLDALSSRHATVLRRLGPLAPLFARRSSAA